MSLTKADATESLRLYSTINQPGSDEHCSSSTRFRAVALPAPFAQGDVFTCLGVAHTVLCGPPGAPKKQHAGISKLNQSLLEFKARPGHLVEEKVFSSLLHI